jgi:carbon monoxide dehydrogenase subunit G
MSKTKTEGRVIRIARPAEVLYSIFSDLTNFTENIPPEMLGNAEVRSTPNTIVGKVQGFEVGMEVKHRKPFSKIEYSQYGATPIAFDLSVNLESLSPGTTDLQIVLETELSGMYKMMLGSKLQEVVDKITDQLEQAMGVFPIQD